MKKRRILVISLSLLCVAGLAAFIYCRFIRVQNVFDQMYYSRTYTESLFSDFVDHRTYFRTMPQLDNPARDQDRGTIWLGNSVCETYDSRFLEEGHMIRLSFHMSSHMLYIDYFIRTDDGQVWYEYGYSVDDRTLTYNTSDPDNLEMKNFLFDRVLTDWFEANAPWTRFSLENPGRYTFIDATLD